MKIKAYKKDFDYTYTLGVCEKGEVLESCPDRFLSVYRKIKCEKG